ncbi:hypothetical protein AwWohl_01480 [Gammaproteobacteria bacterium]|nr:hypothetical protein AwWohl_01480 [Gammaproteobacteria bacterium]
MIVQSHNIDHYKYKQALRKKLEAQGYKRHVIRINAQTNQELYKLKNEQRQSDNAIINRLIAKAYYHWRRSYFALEISGWHQVLGAESNWLASWQSLKINERFWIAHIMFNTHPKHKYLSLSISKLDETHWNCNMLYQEVANQDCPSQSWSGTFEMRSDGIVIFDADDNNFLLLFNIFCRYSRFLSYCMRESKNASYHQQKYPLWRGFVGLEPEVQSLEIITSSTTS